MREYGGEDYWGGATVRGPWEQKAPGGVVMVFAKNRNGDLGQGGTNGTRNGKGRASPSLLPRMTATGPPS